MGKEEEDRDQAYEGQREVQNLSRDASGLQWQVGLHRKVKWRIPLTRPTWRRQLQSPLHVSCVPVTCSSFAQRLQLQEAPLARSPKGMGSLVAGQSAQAHESVPEQCLDHSVRSFIFLRWC
jgi:hypothetical protein